MNADVAALVATTPDQRQRQLGNVALNEYEQATARARRDLSFGVAGLPPNPKLARIRIRARKRALDVALARLGARLAAAGVR